MTLLFVFIGLAYFILRGIVKGIEMARPMDYRINQYAIGIWENPWYPEYHFLDLLKDALLITIVWFSALFPELRHWLWGITIGGWELCELCYSATRNGRYIFRFPENVLGIGLRLWGWSLYTLHVARIVGGILLLWRI